MNRIFWISFGLISVGFNFLFSSYPSLAEKYYFRGFFQVLRVVYDHTLGWLPFPMFYLVLAMTIYLLYSLFRRAIKLFRTKSLLKAMLDIGLGVLALLGFFYGMFYWLWGYNYSKPNFETTMELEVNRISTDQLFGQLNEVHQELVTLRKGINTNPEYLEGKLSVGLESTIREELENFLDEIDHPKNGRVRIRKLYPRGALLRISTAGVYIPFAVEGHIDPGLHPLSWPATMAHEMAHGYGFTDEGTCNFIGYHVCVNSEDTYLRYSGWLMYFRYLYSNARRADAEQFDDFKSGMSKDIYEDLVEMDEYSRRYPDIMPKVRDAVYDSYLKSHGVKEGLMSYSRMILLVDAWNRKSDASFELQEGDLLFQDSDCGPFCEAIEAVTQGAEGYDFSHIGLVMKDTDGKLKVMEAISKGVVLTSVEEFKSRSKDSIGRAKVIVGRLISELQYHIPGAIQFIHSKMSAAYDDVFDLENDKYYCSELIHLAFASAAGKELFDTPPMTFIKPSTDSTFSIWVDYFDELNAPIPEGEPGLNPGSMSRSVSIEIVHRYF